MKNPSTKIKFHVPKVEFLTTENLLDTCTQFVSVTVINYRDRHLTHFIFSSWRCETTAPKRNLDSGYRWWIRGNNSTCKRLQSILFAKFWYSKGHNQSMLISMPCSLIACFVWEHCQWGNTTSPWSGRSKQSWRARGKCLY